MSSDEVRKLMRARASKRQRTITSPLAMYNNVGRLVCKVCRVSLDSDALWAPHCKSARHVQVRHCERMCPCRRGGQYGYLPWEGP